MTEYEKLFNRIADISNSQFPLVDFFNDILQIEDKDYDKDRAYKDIEKICSVIENLIKERDDQRLLLKAIARNIYLGRHFFQKPHKVTIIFDLDRVVYDELKEMPL